MLQPVTFPALRSTCSSQFLSIFFYLYLRVRTLYLHLFIYSDTATHPPHGQRAALQFYLHTHSANPAVLVCYYMPRNHSSLLPSHEPSAGKHNSVIQLQLFFSISTVLVQSTKLNPGHQPVHGYPYFTTCKPSSILRGLPTKSRELNNCAFNIVHTWKPLENKSCYPSRT